MSTRYARTVGMMGSKSMLVISFMNGGHSWRRRWHLDAHAGGVHIKRMRLFMSNMVSSGLQSFFEVLRESLVL